MHREYEYRRERPWRGRDQETELWGREIEHDDWLRGSYGRSPAAPREGWPRPPYVDDSYGRRQDYPPAAWAGQAYADDWTDPHASRSRHWHGRTQMRGFERSDDRIHEEVCSRLCDHPAIDTAEMQVTVEHGEVTLEGTVDDRWEKRMAEDLAESVPGVRDVHNRLRIGADEPRREQGPIGDPTPLAGMRRDDSAQH